MLSPVMLQGWGCALSTVESSPTTDKQMPLGHEWEQLVLRHLKLPDQTSSFFQSFEPSHL